MNIQSFGTITAEDVEDFRKEMRKQRKTNSPAKAKKRLIEIGALTKSGKPTWPIEKPAVVKRRITVKKG